jgi:hypothetical protein
MGRVGKCWSQPARVDNINPKRWAARIRRFEKNPLKVSSSVFEPCSYTWEGEILHGAWRFYFFQKKFF